MPMRLRFALHGTRHNRVFHLIAIEQGKRRDARPAELLGVYNRYPVTGETKKTIEWSVDRIRYWLNVGAIPSRAVTKLLELGNILKPGHPYSPHTKLMQHRTTGLHQEPVSQKDNN